MKDETKETLARIKNWTRTCAQSVIWPLISVCVGILCLIMLCINLVCMNSWSKRTHGADALQQATSAPDDYLAAAREEKDPMIRQMLYMTAIGMSAEKMPILKEYIKYQDELVSDALSQEEPDFSQAEEKLSSLASLCDAAMARGTVDDIRSIPELTSSLDGMAQRIKEGREQLASKQQAEIESIRNRIVSLQDNDAVNSDGTSTLQIADASDKTKWEECQQVIKELESKNYLPECEDEKDSIIAELNAKEACLTPFDQDLQIIEINDEAPWQEWLSHFSERLKAHSDNPELVLQEVEEAASVLEAAKSAKADSSLLQDIDNTAKTCFAQNWSSRVEEYFKQPVDKRSMAEASALLAESAAFTNEMLKNCAGARGKLNDHVMNLAIKACDDNVRIASEGDIAYIMPRETQIQVWSAAMGQYTQLLVQLATAGKEEYPSFNSLQSKLLTAIKGLNEIIKGNQVYVAAATDPMEAKRDRYREYAREKINNARALDNEAEKIADSIWVTRRSEECVWRYREAWYELMRIHPDDLLAVDRDLYDEYKQLKELVQNHWSDYEDYLHAGSGIAKRISDM